MGRSNGSKRNRREEEDDDDDELESAEMKWLTHRQASAGKRQKAMDDEVAPTSKPEKSKNENDSSAPQKKMSTDDKAPQDSPSDANSPEKDTIDKKKLKKQRQKLKQKDKKAKRNERQKSTDNEVVSTSKSEDSKNENDSSAPQKKVANDDEGLPNSPKNGKSPEEEKIEKMKLKKQKQKEKQKVKKAEAALAAEKKKENRKKEAAKALETKQRREQEKKKKVKERQPQQGFVTLAKGVKYQDLTLGKGLPVQDRKKVRVSYTLRSKSHTTGKILDSSANFPFRLGKGEVIKGWDIGLEGMKVGGVRRLVVPPQAGYGNKDIGAGIGADLYFQIDLLHVAPWWDILVLSQNRWWTLVVGMERIIRNELE